MSFSDGSAARDARFDVGEVRPQHGDFGQWRAPLVIRWRRLKILHLPGAGDGPHGDGLCFVRGQLAPENRKSPESRLVRLARGDRGRALQRRASIGHLAHSHEQHALDAVVGAEQVKGFVLAGAEIPFLQHASHGAGDVAVQGTVRLRRLVLLQQKRQRGGLQRPEVRRASGNGQHARPCGYADIPLTI